MLSGLKLTRTTPSTIVASWSSSHDHPVLVKWRPKNAGIDWSHAQMMQLLPTTQLVTIANLADTTTYEVQVVEVQFWPGALSAAIAPPAPPPPPATSPLAFSRCAYGSSLGPNDADHLAGGFVVVQANAAGIALCNKVRAEGIPVKVLCYSALDCVNTADGPGLETVVPYNLANQHEDWFLHRRGARAVKPNDPANILTDFSDVGWQQAALAHLRSIADLADWHGFWFDNVQTNFAFMGGAVDEYATNSILQSAVFTALRTVVGPLMDEGFVCIGNVPGNDLTSWPLYLSRLDGVEIESFTNGNAGATDLEQRLQQAPFMPSVLQQVAACEKASKFCMTHTYSDTGSGFVYALTSALLVADGFTSLNVNTTDNSFTNVWLPECDQVRQIGQPLAPYQRRASGLLFRPFSEAAVVVNPTAAEIDDPAFGRVNAVSGLLR